MVRRRYSALSEGDVLLASYPRSGSNWLALMLGEVLTGSDVEFATRPFPAPWISDLRDTAVAGKHGALPGGARLVRTHEGRRDDRRAIYLVRHPADTAISYFAYVVWRGMPAMDLTRFLDAWSTGSLDGYGTWNGHVNGWLDGPGGIHLVYYERLAAEPAPELHAICEFLGAPVGGREVAAAVAHNTRPLLRKKIERGREVLGLPREPQSPHSGDRPDWHESLDSHQLERLQRGAGDAAERLGYTLEPALARTADRDLLRRQPDLRPTSPALEAGRA